MKINVILVVTLYALFAVSQAKSVTKKASTKISKIKTGKNVKTAKHKDKPVHNKSTTKNPKTKQKDSKNSKKNVIVKPTKKSGQQAVVRTIPDDCNEIIEDYTNGRIIMAEYQVKMGRCLRAKGANGDVSKKAETPSNDLNNGDSADKSSAQYLPTMYVAETRKNNENEKEHDHHHEHEHEHDHHHEHEHEHDLENNSDLERDSSKDDGLSDSDDDYNDDDDDDDDDSHMRTSEKKTEVPAPNGWYQAYGAPSQVMPAQQPGMPGQQSASYYANQAQAQVPAQPQVPAQAQAAFAPSPMNSYQAPTPSPQPMARNEVPNTAQAQTPSMQANTVLDQWRSNSFSAEKKDETPSTPTNEQFAQFMNMQGSNTNPAPSPVSSQQVAPTVDAQQRSYIQSTWPAVTGSEQAPAMPQPKSDMSTAPRAPDFTPMRSDIQPVPEAPAQTYQGPAVTQQRSDIQNANSAYDAQNASSFAPVLPQDSLPVKRSTPEKN